MRAPSPFSRTTNHPFEDDKKETLLEETWTGPTYISTLPKMDSWSRSSERSSRTFLSTFSLPAAAWRPSPRSHSRTPHYQTVSTSLAQRRSTIASPDDSHIASLADLPRRHSETPTPLPQHDYSVPRPSTRAGVRRKPVPALAIEDEVDTVDDPLWDGNFIDANPGYPELRRGHVSREEEVFEEKVRNLSLEELFKGETGLGFLVKELEVSPTESSFDKKPFDRFRRSQRMEYQRSGSYDTDSSTYSATLPVLDTLPYSSTSSSTFTTDTPSTRASSPFPLEIRKDHRPFALLRRRQSRPLEAHGAIIPSLASKTVQAKQEEDLMDAWMDIIVGKEQEPNEKKPALVFQSRPRNRTVSHQPRTTAAAKPRPCSLTSIAHSLPPLLYASSSRRSSIISLASYHKQDQSDRPSIHCREDSDGTDEFHDAESWSSEQLSSLPCLQSVPESPLTRPATQNSPNSATLSTSARFSPVLRPSPSTPSFPQQKPLLQKRSSHDLASQLLHAVSHTAPSNPPLEARSSNPSKRRHSRSISVDFLTSFGKTNLPPRPPKSARRLSKTEMYQAAVAVA